MDQLQENLSSQRSRVLLYLLVLFSASMISAKPVGVSPFDKFHAATRVSSVNADQFPSLIEQLDALEPSYRSHALSELDRLYIFSTEIDNVKVDTHGMLVMVDHFTLGDDEENMSTASHDGMSFLNVHPPTRFEQNGKCHGLFLNKI